MVKGPKSLNPSDKARKEARKKEIKKNKKQRQQIRSAAIEKKDPEQIIAELEKLDRFELDLTTSVSQNDSLIYKDKRKRLMETWTKILAYYLKADPERHAKLVKLEADYEVKHKKLAKEFEAIKAAQELNIEDVFLPPEPTLAIDDIADDDPLLSESNYITILSEGVNPPGCPPGLPPDFKQLAESISTAMSSMPLGQTNPLPPNLISLRLQQSANLSGRAPQPPYRNRIRQGPDRSRPGQQSQWHPKQNLHQPKSNDSADMDTKLKPKTKNSAGPTKSTVIESKPVIFMQKATKFVPSSVRTKLNQK